MAHLLIGFGAFILSWLCMILALRSRWWHTKREMLSSKWHISIDNLHGLVGVGAFMLCVVIFMIPVAFHDRERELLWEEPTKLYWDMYVAATEKLGIDPTASPERWPSQTLRELPIQDRKLLFCGYDGRNRDNFHIWLYGPLSEFTKALEASGLPVASSPAEVELLVVLVGVRGANHPHHSFGILAIETDSGDLIAVDHMTGGIKQKKNFMVPVIDDGKVHKQTYTTVEMSVPWTRVMEKTAELVNSGSP